MKLDKVVEPLPTDSTVTVRPRSALGLKYVELTPGDSEADLRARRHDPARAARASRSSSRTCSRPSTTTRARTRATATEGFGDAFAGRGQSLNDAIRALNPFFTHLTPVMQNLADPDTELDEFFLQIGRASAQVAPVAEVQAELFTNMADTFAAISRDPEALQLTIEKQPATLDTAIQSFRVQRPFLADFADLSRRLRPAAQELPRSLPGDQRRPARRHADPAAHGRAERAARGRDRSSSRTCSRTRTRCSRCATSTRRSRSRGRPPSSSRRTRPSATTSSTSSTRSASTSRSSRLDKSGTVQNQGAKSVNTDQPNNYGTIQSSRNVDIPPGMDARGAKAPLDGSIGPPGEPLHRLQAPLYNPAIDAQGNADCQRGQEGYPNGPFTTGGRYGPGLALRRDAGRRQRPGHRPGLPDPLGRDVRVDRERHRQPGGRAMSGGRHVTTPRGAS